MEYLDNKYTQRLFSEWKMHGKIILAVDFDDTISPWNMQDGLRLFPRVINLVKQVKETGAYIVIFTACNSDRYDEINQYCEAHGLKIDAINQNPIDLSYGNERKIYANHFLDDRAGLDEAMKILEAAMYLYRGEKQSGEKLDDIA